MGAEEFFAEPLAGERDDIVGVLLQGGELRIALKLEGRGLERRREDRVGDHRERTIGIGRQDFRRDTEAVVAGKRIERPTRLLDELRHGRGRAVTRVLREHRREQRRGAAFSRGLEQRARLHDETQVKIREAAVGLQEQPRAVGQMEFGEIADDRGRGAGRIGRGRGGSGIERDRGEALGEQISF